VSEKKIGSEKSNFLLKRRWACVMVYLMGRVKMN